MSLQSEKNVVCFPEVFPLLKLITFLKSEDSMSYFNVSKRERQYGTVVKVLQRFMGWLWPNY